MAGGIDGLGGLDQVVAAFRQAAGGRGAERSARVAARNSPKALSTPG